jgi:cell division protein FtsQ
LKRPQSRPSSAALPKAPATKPAKPAKSPKPNKQSNKREQKRLSRLRTRQKSNGLFQRLSPEAKRFTAYSRRKKYALGTVLISFGSLLLLVLATYVTPLLAVEKIEVAGINRLKEKSIVNALQSQIGKPLPQVSASEIGTALKPFVLIESFSVVSLPPHTLRIVIAERQAIGIINTSGTNYLYDPAGVKIGIANDTELLPVISITGNPATSKTFRAAIDVLLALPAELLDRVAAIDAKSKDDVTLRLRGYANQKIIWGDQSNSVLKSKVLDALIANQKKTDRVTFDVSSPNAPVVLY